MNTNNTNMAQEKKSFKFIVDVIESERGWGQKLDERKEFNSYEEAATFINDFNKDNNESTVPDWYMYATPNNFKLIQK